MGSMYNRGCRGSYKLVKGKSRQRATFNNYFETQSNQHKKFTMAKLSTMFHCQAICGKERRKKKERRCRLARML
jgi:hypothetical protein